MRRHIIWVVLAVAVLACSACGDLSNVAGPSLTSPDLGRCQTAGSTVSILDQQPGC